MKEVIILTIISGLLFIIFSVILIYGIIKKSKYFLLISLITFMLFTGLTGLTIYKVASKSLTRASDILRPRQGEEIYSALFGKPQYDCVTINNYQDQVVPKIDYAIWLEFETCPNEMKRILSQKKYSVEKTINKGFQYKEPSMNNKWFMPDKLGDSIYIYKFVKDDYGNGQTIYTSLDSTKAFCVDILD